MELRKDLLFDNRYLLTQRMGNGATAEVWKALDTKVDNMTIALKIYNNQGKSMDTTGIADFKKELSLVYSLQHTNLLKPSAFDDCQGVPYLVMPYCENGSSSSMVGQMNNDDVLHFLHDVASGLEFLHDRNIVHQDIKPDNILVDDNVDFLITDFGISTDLENEKDGPLGGTRAYMAPERFEGVLSSETDIWSLGATAIEMVTGNPPYGEQGGLGQVASNEEISLPSHISPETTKLIKSMLHTNPLKRPSAYQIRSRIESFQQTGSWDKNARRNKMIYGYTTIMALLFCIGMFFWDRFQGEHIVYYKDYVESINGPIGIGKVSPSEQAHRSLTYKFIYKGSLLDSLVLVNPEGNPTGVEDSEQADSYEIAKFEYTAEGKILRVTEYNHNRQFKYRVVYQDNMRTALYQQNDEHGTEKALRYDMSYNYGLNDHQFWEEEVGCITRCFLEYYDDGDRLLKRKEYASSNNKKVTDANNIHGKEYIYDKKKRLVEYRFIDLNGEIAGDKFGRAITKIEYDKKDNRVKFTYLTKDGKPSHDGQNVTVVHNECDQYGNITMQSYTNIDNKPVRRTADNIFGFKHEYDSNGHCVKITVINNEGNPAYCKKGYAQCVYKYDDNGYLCMSQTQDKNGNPACDIEEKWATRTSINNANGQPTDIKFMDEDGLTFSNVDHNAYIHCEYDQSGNNTEIKWFDKDSNLVAASRYSYDDRNKVIQALHFNENNILRDGVAIEEFQWNPNGRLESIKYLNKDGEKTLNNNIHIVKYDYDEIGNRTCEHYLDTNDNYGKEGWWYKESKYDPVSNLLVSETFFNSKGGSIVSKNEYQYDERGNQTWSRTTDEDSDVELHKYEYDSNNRVIKEWKYYDDEKVMCVIEYQHDDQGQLIKESFWKENGTPDMEVYGCHYVSREYDDFGNLCHVIIYDTKGKPIVPKTQYDACEIRWEYDKSGKVTKLTNYDGHGNSANGKEGWCTEETEYNEDGQTTRIERKTVNGNTEYLYTAEYQGNSSTKTKESVLRKGNGGNVSWFEWTKKYPDDANKYTIETWACLDANKKKTNGSSGWSIQEGTYDLHGNMLKLEYKDINGNLTNDANEQFAQCINEYNDSGKLLRSIVTSYKNGNMVLNNYGWVKVIGEFNDNGQCINKTYYDEHMKKI